MDCLVTKLRASVANPSLPVLESMQQFTLDAIAASGNSSLTDEQMWALNHFFYALGRFDTAPGRIWDKLDYIALPILAGALSNAFVDYKDNTDRFWNKKADIDKCALVDKGVGLTEAAGNTSILALKKESTTGIASGFFSFITAYVSTAKRNTDGPIVYDENSPVFRYSATDLSAQAVISGYSNSYLIARRNSPIVSVRADVANDAWSIQSIENNEVVSNDTSFSSEYYEAHSYTEKYAGIVLRQFSYNSGLQIAIAGEYLSDDDALIVLNAVNDLRNALLL